MGFLSLPRSSVIVSRVAKLDGLHTTHASTYCPLVVSPKIGLWHMAIRTQHGFCTGFGVHCYASSNASFQKPAGHDLA